MTITYYAHLQQKGEGCDYTIGCGHALRRLASKTIDEAKVEALAEADEESCTFESRIERLSDMKSVRVLAVVEECDLSAEIAAKISLLRDGQATETKKRKLAEIERLKKEVGAS